MAVVASISQQIWDMKYRLKDADGTPRDHTIDDSWQRVATALAQSEKNPATWVEPFHEAQTSVPPLCSEAATAGGVAGVPTQGNSNAR